MPSGRKDIPNNLERALMIEAGHRCAIPTCRVAAPLEIEHIDDYTKVKRHDFANMIVLCRNCHGLKGTGPRSLDRKALRQYKANLQVINSRYGDIELRVLRYFAQYPDRQWTRLPGGGSVFVINLLLDGFLSLPYRLGGDAWHDLYYDGRSLEITKDPDIYEITTEGRSFVSRWAQAMPLDEPE
jgi:hypothetical protein